MIKTYYSAQKSLLNFLVVLICMFFVSLTLRAQNIKGKTIDIKGVPLQTVSVVISNIDLTNRNATITSADGTYNFSGLQKGSKYHLQFSLSGYNKVDTTFIFFDNQELNVQLSLDKKILKEVSVTSTKNIIERRIDRLVFNVENNINTVGLDGLDILGKTPMVRVDDNAISLIGKSGVGIMIDNRPTHLSGEALTAKLKSLSADNISKIEVITNPPAEYDAQGNSGLINIITKKAKDPGYLVSISERMNVDTYLTNAPSVNFNYNVGKFLVFANVGTSSGANGPTNTQSRYYNTQTWDESDRSKERSHFYDFSGGFDYLISKKTTIGASYDYFISHPNFTSTNTTNITHIVTGAIDSVINVNAIDQKTFKSQTFNFHVVNKLDSLGKDVQVDFDYYKTTTNLGYNTLNYNTLANGALTSMQPTNVESDNDVAGHGYLINLVTHIPLKKINLTFGAKASFIVSQNAIAYYRLSSNTKILDTTGSNQFRFDENTQAVFASMNTSLGKFKLQLGLREEFTQTEGISPTLNQVHDNDYSGFFPTFYITYPLSKKDVISFNVGRRIGRPNFSSYNPFKVYQSEYNYNVGNPDLRPSFSENVELSNTYNHLLNTSVSYSRTTGSPTTILLINNGSNIQETTVGNYVTSNNFVFDNSISTPVVKWLQTSDGVTVYYNNSFSTAASTQSNVHGFGANLFTSNSVYFNSARTFLGGVDFNYQFPYVSGISEFRKYYWLDLSGSALFLNRNLQVSLALRDLFKTKYVSFYTMYNGIGTLTTANNDTRRLIVNVKYAFGNMKLKKGQSHSSSGLEQSRTGH